MRKAVKVAKMFLPKRFVVDSRKPLWDWIKTHEVKTIMEIGLGSGDNAEQMIKLAKGCHYYGFDDLSWEGFYESMDEVFERVRLIPNTHFFIGNSMEILPLVIDMLPDMDVIFVDGYHLHPVVDIDWKFCKLKMHDGSVCFFHDCHKGDVKEVVDGIDRRKYTVEMIPTKDNLFAEVQLRKEVES